MDRLENVFAAAPCGVAVVDEASRKMLYTNDAYYTLVGCTREEYAARIGGDYLSMIFAPDKEVSGSNELRFAKNGRIPDREYRIVRQDGDVRWIRLNAARITVDGNSCALCFFEDVTPEKESCEQLHLVAQNIGSSISVLLVTGEKGRLLYANDTFFKWVGTERDHYSEDVLEYNMSFVAPEDRPATLAAVHKSALTGEPQDLEYRFLRPGEPPRWMNRRLAALKRDEPDSFLVASIVTDITEQKNAELMGIAERERYQSVMDNIPCGLVKVRVEPDGRSGPVFVNKAFLTMTDMPLDDMMKLYQSDSCAGIHPDDVDRIREMMLSFRPGESRTAVYRLRKGKSGWVWVRIHSYIKEEDGVMMLYNSYLDIDGEIEKSAMLDSLVNRLPGGVAIFRVAEKLECRYFSEGFVALSGYTQEELARFAEQGELFERSVYPPDLPLCLEKIRTLSAKGLPVSFTYRSIKNGGAFQWLTVSASLIREENGCPVYYCIFTTPPDEAALYQSMAENSSIGMIVSDTETHEVYYTNRAFRDMMYIEDEMPAGKKCYEYVRGQTHPCQNCAALDLKPDETVTAIHHFPQFGTYLKVRSSLVQWAGHTALLEYNVDITEEYQERIRQRELINNVPAGLGFTEIVNGKVRAGYMNDFYYSIVGESREERLRKMNGDVSFFTHPEDIGKSAEATQRLIGGSDRESVLQRILCGDGTYRWFRTDLSVAHRDSGRIMVYNSYVDCDEVMQARIAQDQAAAVLQKQYEMEQSQRTLLEQESAMALRFNATKDKLIGFTKTRDISFTFPEGCSMREIITEMQKQLPSEDERKRFMEFYDGEKNLARFKAGLTDFSSVFHVRQKDGCLHWMQHICRMMQDESRDVIVYAFINDVSDERNNELAIRSVIDDEMDVILLVNAVTGVARILRINKGRVQSRYKANEEFPLEHILGDRISTVIPEDLDAVRSFLDLNNLKERLKTEPAAALTALKTDSSGAYRRARVQAYYLDDDRESIVVTSKDITESYEEEQRVKRGLEAANKAKAEFLSRVSHDMRTPLNAVLGFTKLLQEEAELPEEAAGYLKNIDDSGKYLLGLISDVLDMSKIEEGKLELHPQPYYYKEFEETLRTLLQPKAEEKGVEFVMLSGMRSLETVYFDELRLQQIFVNLIGNAIKFTPKGGRVEFAFSDGTITEDGHLPLTFTVCDNGIGMSEEFLQSRMYQPFEQERLSGRQTETGTGLGLSIAKQLIEQMGGTIECESMLGSGTTFTVKLSPAIGGKYEDPVTKKEASYERLSGARILVCEDNRMNTVIARKLLEKVGCHVETAENGSLGVEKFSASKPGEFAAILMDIRMPVMDGLEATKAIRALERPDAASVPIIAMSANAFDEDVKTSLDAGMNAHLAKPVEPQRMYETLTLLIPQRQK